MNEETKETILTKITKLLSLASSDNVNEAENAAAKAQELLLKYNLTESDLNSFNDATKEVVVQVRTEGKTKYNRTAWYSILANTVADANLCRLLTSGSALIWIGKKTNIEVAQYIFENLVRDLQLICEKEWAIFNIQQIYTRPYNKVHGKTWKNSFYHGANQSIRERLRKSLVELKEANSEITALVINNDVELDEYMDAKYPHLRHIDYNLRRDRSGYDSGKAAGRSVQFRSGIGAGGSSGPRLLDKG